MHKVCNNPSCYMHSPVTTEIKDCLACGQPLKDPYEDYFTNDSIPVDADFSTLFGGLWRSGGKR